MKNTKQTFVIALAMMFTLTIGSSLVFGQDKDDKQSVISPPVEEGNTLTGVWQSVSPTVDCQTGEPNGPPIRVLSNFIQGGTLTISDTNEIDGPYRSPIEGIWKRVLGRNYAYVGVYYAFNPDRTFAVSIKLRENLTLNRDGNSFAGSGTFEVFLPSDDVNPILSGCFTDAGTRLQF
jgi:hypothetical protein